MDPALRQLLILRLRGGLRQRLRQSAGSGGETLLAELPELAVAIAVVVVVNGLFAFAEEMGVAGYFLVRRDNEITATSTSSFENRVMM